MFRPALIILALVLSGCASTYHERYRYYADAGHGDYYYETRPRHSMAVGFHSGFYDPFWSVGFHSGPWYPYSRWGHAGWYGPGPGWGWGYWGGYHRPWWYAGYHPWDRHYAWNWHWWHAHPQHRPGPRDGLRGRVQQTVRGPVAGGRPGRGGPDVGVRPGQGRSAARAMVPDTRSRAVRPELRPRPAPATPIRGAERGWQRPGSPASGRPVTPVRPSRADAMPTREQFNARAPRVPSFGTPPSAGPVESGLAPPSRLSRPPVVTAPAAPAPAVRSDSRQLPSASSPRSPQTQTARPGVTHSQSTPRAPISRGAGRETRGGRSQSRASDHRR